MRASPDLLLRLALLVLAVLLIGDDANAEPCAIRSQAAHVRNVQIKPAGESAFQITLAGVPLVAQPIDDSVASLHVQSPLRFSTEHGLNQLGVVTAGRVSLLDGRLVLARGLSGQFIADEQYAPDLGAARMSMPLQALAPVQPIDVPCDELTVPNETSNFAGAPRLDVPAKAKLHATSESAFPLYARRKEESPWMIRFDGPLVVVQQAGNWIEVRARWTDGSVLHGWSTRDHLNVHEPEIRGDMGELGSIGFGHCGRSHHRRPLPFVLKANAPIHTRARGAIWAHTAGEIKVEAFPIDRSDGWLQIASIDGLPPGACSDHNKFWVHAENVQWTSEPI